MAESGGIRRRFGGLSPALRDRRSPCKRSPHRCRPLRPAAAAGPVAQWLEPAAHNGLVAGSSPAGPTNEINYLSILIFSTPPEIPTGSGTISTQITKSSQWHLRQTGPCATACLQVLPTTESQHARC